MPYYLETDDRELLKKLRLTNVCAECGERLEALYDLGKHLPYLQCKADPKHKDIAKEYQGEFIQPIIDRREKMTQDYGKVKAKTLMKYEGMVALTKPQAMEIMETIWPEAPIPDKQAAALLCTNYGLNPLMGHVFLIPFDEKKTGKTTWARVVGIKAKRLISSRKGAVMYLDMSPRLMTEKEQIKVWGKVDKDNICSLTHLRDPKTGAEAYGYGKWPVDIEPKGTNKGNSKENMSGIRSESQGLDRLRPGEMPMGIAVVDEEYVEVPDVGKVVKATGEIIEGEVTEITEEKPPVEVSEPSMNVVHQELEPLEEKPAETKKTEPHIAIDMPWLIDSVNTLKWDILKHIKETFQVSTQGSLKDVVARLSRGQQEAVCKAVQERLDLKGT